MDWHIPHQRQAGGGSQSQKRAIAAQRHPLPNCRQTSLLTKTSWDSRRLTSTGRISSPEETHSTPEKVCPLYTQKTEWLGWGRGEVSDLNWGQLRMPSTWSPELLEPGTGAKHRPNQVCAFVEYPRT